MSLLTQTILTQGTYSAPVETDAITLPGGCQNIAFTLSLSPGDAASSKSLAVEMLVSIDEGASWLAQGLAVFGLPSTVDLTITGDCSLFPAAVAKAVIAPDALGVTLSATVDVS